MPVDPLTIVGEILGEPAALMRNPANADYRCPFLSTQCVKRSHNATGPYPVCSIWVPAGGRPERPSGGLTCVCPKRFFEVDFLNHVVARCWPGEAPANPQVVHEIKMQGFGNVDFVIADISDDGYVREFVSVELQAVDITGSVYPAYAAVVGNQSLAQKPSYGLNLRNVYKRYVSQLIAKGFYHHHWGTKIVAVIQDRIYESIQAWTPFPTFDPRDSNIVFMVYSFEPIPEAAGRYRLVLTKTVGTHHSNLQSAVLYKTPPDKAAFIERIKAQLGRG